MTSIEWRHTVAGIMGVFLFGGTAALADLRTGLVAYYPFSGNANDASGNGHDGTPLIGTTLTADRFGNPNRAYAFDGVDDVITIPDAPALNFVPTSQMTVSLWAYRVAPTLCMHLVGKRAACGPPFNYQLALNEGNGQGLCFGSDSGMVNTGQGLPMYAWKHLAGTFDGTTFRFYVDGLLVGSASGTLGPVVKAPLQIGGAGSCATFCGSIDEVRIYNRALSEAEIQQLAGTPVDSDGDSVPDEEDQCPNTPSGEIVDAGGCSISQLVPPDAPWKNHGQYLSAVAKVAGEFMLQDLITAEQMEEIVSAAARSNVGKGR